MNNYQEAKKYFMSTNRFTNLLVSQFYSGGVQNKEEFINRVEIVINLLLENQSRIELVIETEGMNKNTEFIMNETNAFIFTLNQVLEQL